MATLTQSRETLRVDQVSVSPRMAADEGKPTPHIIYLCFLVFPTKLVSEPLQSMFMQNGSNNINNRGKCIFPLVNVY